MINKPDSYPRRPWIVWAFALIMLLVVAANLLLAWDHARHAAHYRDLGVSYPPLLRAGFALGWSILFGIFTAGLIRRRVWSQRWIVILVSNYGAFNVLWLIVYARSDFSREAIPFRALIAVLAGTLTALFMRWRRVRRAFDPLPTEQAEL